MSSQLKRMTFSIYMDPGALESDRYAVGVLQNWYQRARKIQDGAEEFDFSKSRFHKDIYLSGMFMYVLAPNLCKAVANALGPEQVSLMTLRHAFASCGFTLGEGSEASPSAADAMVDQIVARLGPRLGQGNSGALVDEIVSRLGQQAATPDQDYLVDEIVNRLGQQAATPDQGNLVDEIVNRLGQQAATPDQDYLVDEIVNRLGQQAATPDQDYLVDEIVNRLGQQAAMPDQGNLVDEIVNRLGQQAAMPDQGKLVDEIVSRLGEQQPTEWWDEIRQGLPGSLDPEQLADAIAGRLPAAAEPDLAPLASSILQLSRQLEEQSRLIREQHSLIQRLASQPGRSVHLDKRTAEPLIEDLSSQVANMKKVKARGLF
ncbi:hypothetical protein M2366_001576 [Aeromonas sp. BIGb0405]|uniref:hypothetical protein n=1 Tax=Aeromonas sp. BIGb0405 TaxID=2940592 RepID=UPI0021685691|nr:hypothetical protein [Aeromonas sp. BIGb0405]MCS3455509.1 hypothetical protein [Aeromonas sp. BIGb0405]